MKNREIQVQDVERLNGASLHLPAHGKGNGKGNGNGETTKEALARLDPSWRNAMDFLACSRTSISGLLSRGTVCVAPDLSVEGLTTLLLERGLNAVPVIDEKFGLVGIVSTADLLREVQDRGEVEERMPLRVPERRDLEMEIGDGFHATYLARATVEEIMTPCSFTVPETASVGQAAALMAFEGVGQLPVVGPGHKLVGTLTALEVLRWLAQQSGFLLSPPMRTKGDDHAATARQELKLRPIGATLDRETSSLSRQTATEEERPLIEDRVSASDPAADLPRAPAGGF